MRFRSSIEVQSVSLADDLQRCLSWSTALAAPQKATSVTLLLGILEAGAGTTAQRVLAEAGATTEGLEPLDVAARGPQPPPPRGLRRLVRLPPGLSHRADVDLALRRASEQCLIEKRRIVTSDDLFLALLIQDGPAKDTLVSLGMDPSAMRSQVMRSRPAPD